MGERKMNLKDFLDDPRFIRLLSSYIEIAEWFKDHNFEEKINSTNETLFDMGVLLGETNEWRKKK